MTKTILPFLSTRAKQMVCATMVCCRQLHLGFHGPLFFDENENKARLSRVVFFAPIRRFSYLFTFRPHPVEISNYDCSRFGLLDKHCFYFCFI
jgi:hypothetical protein